MANQQTKNIATGDKPIIISNSFFNYIRISSGSSSSSPNKNLAFEKKLAEFYQSLFLHTFKEKYIKNDEDIKRLSLYYMTLEGLHLDFRYSESFVRIIKYKLESDLKKSLVHKRNLAYDKIKELSPVFGREINHKLKFIPEKYISLEAHGGTLNKNTVNLICERNLTITVSCACNSIAAFATLDLIAEFLPINCSFEVPYGKEQFKRNFQEYPYNFVIVGNPAFFFSDPSLRNEYLLILPLHTEKCAMMSSSNSVTRKYFAEHSTTHAFNLLTKNRVESIGICPSSLLTSKEELFESNVGFFAWDPLAYFYKYISLQATFEHYSYEHVVSVFVNKNFYSSQNKLVHNFMNVFMHQWVRLQQNSQIAKESLLRNKEYLKAFYASSGMINIHQ